MAKTLIFKSKDAGSFPAALAMATWQKGDASGCNPEGSGSSPDVASKS